MALRRKIVSIVAGQYGVAFEDAWPCVKERELSALVAPILKNIITEVLVAANARGQVSA